MAYCWIEQYWYSEGLNPGIISKVGWAWYTIRQQRSNSNFQNTKKIHKIDKNLLTWIWVIKCWQNILLDRNLPLIIDNISSNVLCGQDFITHAAGIIYSKQQSYISLHSQEAIERSSTDFLTEILKKFTSLAFRASLCPIRWCRLGAQ